MAKEAGRGLGIGLRAMLGLWASLAVAPAIGADQEDAAATAAHERAILMKRYIVSATRIDRNPWRYASIPGFEVLSRAPNDDTQWMLDSLQSGLWIENQVLPEDWRPDSPVPYTVIIDDTNLASIADSQLHPPTIDFQPPIDLVTWGSISDIDLWVGPIAARDNDTFAFSTNLYGVDTATPAYGSASLERLSRCAPPIPRWLMVGLLGRDCGMFRESFAPIKGTFRESTASAGDDFGFGARFEENRAVGPGTLWVSLEKTKQLLAKIAEAREDAIGDGLKEVWQPELHRRIWVIPDRKLRIGIPSLQTLFAERPPPGKGLLLWESEAALFVRWGLLGRGHDDPAMSRAFLELVRRARREPVTEQVFADCFGFRYEEMEQRLEAYLKEILAQPTSVHARFPRRFPEVSLKEATADQIGRILGDWLRMQGDSLRADDPAASAESLGLAGRMLERAYREDNGLPPDVEPFPGGERTASSNGNAAFGPAVSMKPIVVTATRIHDPDLLAVYGLYEHDAGNDGKARELLEAAVRAGAKRPMAYLALARLRFAEAIAKPMGSAGKLTARQAAAILEPLRVASKDPPNLEACSLLADVWVHSDAGPTRGDVDRIVEGAARYPRSTDLAYRSALACANGGYAAEAASLIGEGLVFATDKGDVARFERLRSALGPPGAPRMK